MHRIALIVALLLTACAALVQAKSVDFPIKGELKWVVGDSEAFLTYPDAATASPILKEDQALYLAFSLDEEKATSPYAALILQSTHDTTADIVQPLTVGNDYRIAQEMPFETATWKEKASLLSGTYTASIAIATKDKHWHWSIGEVTFDVPAPELKPLHQRLEPKPLIQHVFRQEEKHAPVVLSTLFALLCLVPWVFLASRIQHLQVKLAVTQDHTATIGFFGSLIAVLGVLMLYWTVLNFFQMIPWLVLASASTALFARQLILSRTAPIATIAVHSD